MPASRAIGSCARGNLRPQLPSPWQPRLIQVSTQVEPVRVSFHTAQHAIVGAIHSAHLARAASLPELLKRLLEQARYFVLPPRRANRSFPRVVKRSARSKYPSKKCQSGLN